jgi:MFS transporter, PAT family, beta-lactamase induction signal transducer AmpG
LTSRHRRPPVWLMGLTNTTYGLYAGTVAFAIPQLLSNRNVPESAIAGLTAVAYSPGFWAFLFSPVLDVRFSRRWYAFVLALVACVTLVLALTNLDHLVLLAVTLTTGFFAAYLYQSAVGGWLSSIIPAEQENTLSVWLTIGNVGGFGLMAVLCNQLVVHLPPLGVALILGVVIMLPSAVFPFMQAPGPDRRLAKESFSEFFRDLVSLVKRREVLIAIVLFIAPAGTFSLTNFLGGLGNVFHASPGFVGMVAGAGGAVGGIAGCLLFPPLSRLMPLRPLYLAIGFVGSLITFALILLAHTPTTFAIALIGENLLQALAITNSTAIILETIGRDNPLASTTFCFVGSAYGVPISYMLYVDAFGYRHGGPAGSFAADAATGLTASLLLGLMLFWLARRSRRRLSV